MEWLSPNCWQLLLCPPGPLRPFGQPARLRLLVGSPGLQPLGSRLSGSVPVRYPGPDQDGSVSHATQPTATRPPVAAARALRADSRVAQGHCEPRRSHPAVECAPDVSLQAPKRPSHDAHVIG